MTKGSGRFRRVSSVRLLLVLAAVPLARCADVPVSPPCKVVLTPPSLVSHEALRTLGGLPPFSLEASDSTEPALGDVIVNACVDGEGNLAGAPEIARSSGSAQLDSGALRLARRLHYTPLTCDSKPVFGCLQFKVTFWPGPPVKS